MRRTHRVVSPFLSGICCALYCGCAVPRSDGPGTDPAEPSSGEARVATLTTLADAREPAPAAYAELSDDDIKARAQAVISKAKGRFPAGDATGELSARQLLYKRATEAANSALSELQSAARQDAAAAAASGQARKSAGQAAATDRGEAQRHLYDAETLLERAESLETTLYGPWFRAHAGLATVSPYRVEVVDGVRELTPTSKQTFYAEVQFTNRTAWLQPSDVSASLDDQFTASRIFVPKDYELRLGFLNDSAIDDTEAAASGDWYTEASLGWPIGLTNISRDRVQDGLAELRGTYNIELNGGFVTNRGELSSNGYYQLGFSTVWNLPIRVADNVYRNGAVFAGIFFGTHEYPRVDIDNRLWITEADIPYNRLGSIGVKMDFYVPLTKNMEAVIGGRFASPVSRKDVAEDWSLFVGVTVPIGRWIRDLGGAEDT